MNIVIENYTDHPINYLPNDVVDITTWKVKTKDIEALINRCIVLPPVGHAVIEITRDVEERKFRIAGTNKECVVNYSYTGVVQGLPPEEEGKIFIVSQLTFNAIHNIRKDVYQIDRPIRSEQGRVIACRAFSRTVYSENNKIIRKAIDFIGENAKLFPDQAKLLKHLSSLNKFVEK